jgi:uncharacterized spore protein YtfJ
MSSIQTEVGLTAVKTPIAGMELLGKLTAVTQPNAVFSPPIHQGDYTVITASEVAMGYGYGFGGGGGVGPASAKEGEEPTEAGGGGMGGGGGGSAMARPVAAVIIGPKGVKVEPIMDPTKISLAFFTAFAAILIGVARALKQE